MLRREKSMKTHHHQGGGGHQQARPFSKFRMPTAENLIPIKLDLELEGQRLKDAFIWNADDADSEIVAFAKELVNDLNLPISFIQQVAQSMQCQVTEFRSLQGQEISTEEKIQVLKLDLRVNNILIHDQFLWDVSNFDSDPEGFAMTFCKDLEIEDPEVAPCIAFAIREQLYEIAKQSITTGRETRISKKFRRERGLDYTHASVPGTNALTLMRRPSSKISILRRRNEWDFFEPSVELLTEKEVEVLDARDERNARFKKRLEDKEDSFANRYVRV